MKNELYYIEEQENNKKLIIFIHPKNISSWVFINQFDSFDEYHNIYVDLPCHGDSYCNNDFNIVNTVEILKDLILKLNKDEVNLVGIGLGGQIAIDLTSKYPDLINKVIISGVETINTIPKCYFDFLDESKKILDSKNTGFLTLAYLRHYGISREFFEEIFKDCENPNYENLKKISYESMNYSLPLKPINKEILILYGEYDTLWVKKSSCKIKKLFNGGKILEIKNATHLWNIRKHEKFNQITKEFLAI